MSKHAQPTTTLRTLAGAGALSFGAMALPLSFGIADGAESETPVTCEARDVAAGVVAAASQDRDKAKGAVDAALETQATVLEQWHGAQQAVRNAQGDVESARGALESAKDALDALGADAPSAERDAARDALDNARQVLQDARQVLQDAIADKDAAKVDRDAAVAAVVEARAELQAEVDDLAEARLVLETVVCPGGDDKGEPAPAPGDGDQDGTPTTPVADETPTADTGNRDNDATVIPLGGGNTPTGGDPVEADQVSMYPVGGVAAGDGSTGGGDHIGLALAGMGALGLAGGAGVYARRRATR